MFDSHVLWRDPYPLLARLRDERPVAWAPALGRWLVTRRSIVLDVLRDPEAFTTLAARFLGPTLDGVRPVQRHVAAGK